MAARTLSQQLVFETTRGFTDEQLAQKHNLTLVEVRVLIAMGRLDPPEPEELSALEMFEDANHKMEDLVARHHESGFIKFSDYLRAHPEDRGTMADIRRIREEAHNKLTTELGE